VPLKTGNGIDKMNSSRGKWKQVSNLNRKTTNIRRTNHLKGISLDRREENRRRFSGSTKGT
jgi:hypothetical protein